jgi:phosphoribosylformimino-5-aminoimidazole carboxamide ribotide isomerase
MTSSILLQVIPVLDVARGQVVRGIRGERSAYRPIVSTLVAGSDPLAVAAALLPPVTVQRGPALPLYVADLDAIQGGQLQVDLLRRLLALRDDVCLWLDAGLRDLAAGVALRNALGASSERVRLVYASESLAAGGAVQALADDAQAILSLDCRLARPLDPAGLWSRPELWPRTLIVMTLDRVGAGAGPDLSTLARLRALAPDRQWVGAGGIRDRRDLQSAAAAGASAWLVASALHDGSLRQEW